MIVKIHLINNKKIVVVTDSEIIGKKYEEGNKQLDLTSDFFKGNEMNEDELKLKISNADIINVTGIKSIDCFKKLNLIDEIIVIDNIPHAEILLEKGI